MLQGEPKPSAKSDSSEPAARVGSKGWLVMGAMLTLVVVACVFRVPRWLNQTFDRDPGVPHAVRVLLTLPEGKRTPPTVHTSSWSGSAPLSFEVTAERLSQLNEGDLVCVWVRPGALGVEWTELRPMVAECE